MDPPSATSSVCVTQNAQAAVGSQQTRIFSYDGLGRMTGQRDPETSNTVFAYDSDATCGTSNGDLVRKVDQAGNVTCYQYDAMHRVTMISYPSGPNAAVTPSKRFIYDTYSGAANAKGRLAVAYTCWPATCSTNWLTPELFSYSARGEVTDFYQVTPHSGGAYHLSAAYWPHGALRNFTGLPSLPTIYYGDGAGLDGEGRLTKVSASSGVNPLVPAAVRLRLVHL